MSEALSGRALAERISPETASLLRVVSGALGVGISFLIGLSVFLHRRSFGRTPTLEQLRVVNLLTTVAMAFALAVIFASEMAWKAVLKKAVESNVERKVRVAFLVRSLLREAGALVGCIAALLAAGSGTLRVYPAYWADLVPAALFGSYLYAHWPSHDSLKAEIAEVLSA